MKTQAGFVIAVFLFAAIPAAAFEAKDISLSGGKRPLKWNTAKGPVILSLNTKGSADIPITDTEKSLLGAMNVWQGVSGQSLRFSYRGRDAGAVSNSSDMKNSIFWMESGWTYSSSVLAVTRYSYFITDPPYLADVDVLMNGQHIKWSVTATNNENSVHPQQVLVHELGHLIGLSHTSVYSAALYPYISAKIALGLTPDDKSGLVYLYGSPPSDFRLVNPISNAAYMEGMAPRALPLPVFRWSRGGLSSFTLEFSDTTSFQKKITYPAGTADFYAINASQEQQLTKLSPSKKVFWRVVSGPAKTTSRAFRFTKPLVDMWGGSAALIDEVPTPQELPRYKWLFFPTIFLVLMLIALIVWNRKAVRI